MLHACNVLLVGVQHVHDMHGVQPHKVRNLECIQLTLCGCAHVRIDTNANRTRILPTFKETAFSTSAAPLCTGRTWGRLSCSMVLGHATLISQSKLGRPTCTLRFFPRLQEPLVTPAVPHMVCPRRDCSSHSSANVCSRHMSFHT